MRILHTADWHLCDRLHRLDRTADLEARVEKVAGLCAEHAVEVLLIAGDLFSEQASVEQMTASLHHLYGAFADFFARGGTVLAVTGNHDRDGRINMIRAGMRLASPAPQDRGRLARGRMYLLNGCFLAALEGAAGEVVQFALVPYPTVARYAEADDRYRTKEEENRLLLGRVAERIRDFSGKGHFDPALPAVLVAHLHVRGAEIHSLYKLTERDDVVFEPGFLSGAWAYVALGHVHKPQELPGLPHVRYSGSLDRLDFGERHDDRGVLLVDVGRGGLDGEPAWLPLEPTPFYDVALNDPSAELPELEKLYPDRGRAIVRVTARPDGKLGRDDITRAVRGLFPRLAELKWADSAPAGADGVGVGFTPRADAASTVRDYLGARLKDDPDCEAVLALAERFLALGGEG